MIYGFRQGIAGSCKRISVAKDLFLGSIFGIFGNLTCVGFLKRAIIHIYQKSRTKSTHALVECGVLLLYNSKFIEDLLSALKTEKTINGLHDLVGFDLILV